MANIDRLARAENELKTSTEQLEKLQTRVKTIQQRVLKLRSERILELVKNAGMGPDEVKEMLLVYKSGRMLQRFDAGGPEENTGGTEDHDQEVRPENETT